MKGYQMRRLFKILITISIATLLSVAVYSSVTSALLPTESLNGASKIYPDISTKIALPERQFDVNAAYAYVGPAPSNASYFDKGFNTTMDLASKYPSILRLNFSLNPAVQIESCDAIVEVYGIKIATDTGATEYFAFGIGTNYNTSFTKSEEAIIFPNIRYLVDYNCYKGLSGCFNFNWTASPAILTNNIGSICRYIGYRPNATSDKIGLSSAGLPNSISIEIYRIGYVTMNDGSVSIYKDSVKNIIASINLPKYNNGFLYNKLVPEEELPETDLFKPTALFEPTG